MVQVLNHNQIHKTPQAALAHYGVKGMKWGVRKDDRSSGGSGSNGPALSAKKQKKADDFFDKAAKARALAKEMDELGIDSPEMRRLYGEALDRGDRMFAIMYGQSKDKAVQRQIEFEQKRAEYLQKNAEAIESGKLTSTQKKALIGGLAAAAVVGYVGYATYKDSQFEKAGPGDAISARVFQRRYMESSNQYMGHGLKGYDFLDDNDVRVPKGTTFSRLTAYKDEDLDGRLYTTFTEADNNKYRGIYGPALRSRTGQRQLYISHMEVGIDVRSPSHRKRVELYADLLRELNNDPDTPAFRQWHGNLALQHYNSFARGLVAKNEINEKYFKKVQEAGYNALIDDNDAGMLAELPMILLNPKSMVSNRTFEPLTAAIERQARKNFTEIRRVNKEGLTPPEEYRDSRSPSSVEHIEGALMDSVLNKNQTYKTPQDALVHYSVSGRR